MKNKNDIPLDLKDINSISYNDFKFKSFFEKVCDLIPNLKKEKIEIKNLIGKGLTNKGLVYCFVINNKVVKIGNTITTIKERIQSYNCGKQKYRDKGTCSTTNYFVLQTFLKTNENIEVYGFFPEKQEIDVFGTKYFQTINPKQYEAHILKYMKDKNIFPILCIQG